MRIEKVIVAGSSPRHADILARDNRHCRQCAANTGCGHYLLDTTGIRPIGVLRLPLPEALFDRVKPGDTLSLGMQETRLMQLAVMLYGVPLAAMLAGTLLPALVLGASAPDAWSVPGAVVGLIAGLLLVRRYPMSVPARLVTAREQANINPPVASLSGEQHESR